MGEGAVMAEKVRRDEVNGGLTLGAGGSGRWKSIKVNARRGRSLQCGRGERGGWPGLETFTRFRWSARSLMLLRDPGFVITQAERGLTAAPHLPGGVYCDLSMPA